MVRLGERRWFTIVLAISVLIRLYLAIFTQGTYDIAIWEKHARAINEMGLTEYYKATLGQEPWTGPFNHPPVIGKLISYLFSFCDFIHVPFRVIFRLIFASLDFVISYYLLKIFADSPYRYLYTAFYLLNPITFIFSAYHGNTDTSLGLFVLLSVYFISRKRFAAAGMILGLGAWVKWIVLMTFPVFLFAIPELRAKVRFMAFVTLAFVLGYSWYLVKEPTVIVNGVFRYTGQLTQTTAGIPLWGNRIFLYKGLWMSNILYYNNAVILILVIVYSWLQRHRESSLGIGKTVCEVFFIFYGVTNFWSFQYLVWSAPFWVFLSLPLSAIVTFITSGYIYSLYSLLCGSLLLRGTWDFAGHPYPSGTVLFFRNMSVLLFIALTIYFFKTALFTKK
jgi:hypothetical protein